MPLTRETVIKWSEDVLFAYQRSVELSVPFELAGILSDLILLTSRVDTAVNGIILALRFYKTDMNFILVRGMLIALCLYVITDLCLIDLPISGVNLDNPECSRLVLLCIQIHKFFPNVSLTT